MGAVQLLDAARPSRAHYLSQPLGPDFPGLDIGSLASIHLGRCCLDDAAAASDSAASVVSRAVLRTVSESSFFHPTLRLSVAERRGPFKPSARAAKSHAQGNNSG